MHGSATLVLFLGHVGLSVEKLCSSNARATNQALRMHSLDSLDPPFLRGGEMNFICFPQWGESIKLQKRG